ncbi:MAG: hypothetical protein QOJ09_1533 [Actinomycetota bacterium]|nr:hypothetical protein [Actinomycetota bacterium]
MRRAVLVFLLCVPAACTSHPVGPARTAGKYEGKAVTTADGALSSVNTVRIAARTGSNDHAFGPYLSVLVSEQEDTLSGLQGTFDSIQPPDGRADDLKTELDNLLSDALDHVTDVRVAVRRGELRTLAEQAKPLTSDAVKLQAFTEAHK